MRRAALFSLVLLLAETLHLQAQETGVEETDPLQGIAVGIVQHGRVFYSRGIGLMKLGQPEEPVTPETLFHMASITRTFVAAAVTRLWEQGKVDPDAPVVRYVPDFRMDDPRRRRITVREMLDHSSGIPGVEDYDRDHPRPVAIPMPGRCVCAV